MSNNLTVDVAIIGAGIAGCHLAQLLAHRGIKVLLVDKKASPLAGPTWINAVPLWMFDEANLLRPQGKEIFDLNDRFIIRAPKSNARLVINQLGVADVHMGLLAKRLKDYFFAQSQARFLQCAIKYAQYQGSRLVAIVGDAGNAGTITIRAQHFVDASGIKGIIKTSHPQAKDTWPAVLRADTCTAAQRTLEIRDRNGAVAFLDKEGIKPTDVLSDVGIMGGYSLFRVQVDKSLNHISILCGVRSLPELKTASVLVNDFVAKHPWIGKAFVDGRGTIPLNAPYHRLALPGLAILGDAACQVYSAHGSGIGIGLIAARMLADAIVDDKATAKGSYLAAYEKQFHCRYYQRLYFSEHFRRFSQSFSPRELSRLLASGILGEELTRQTLVQEEPKLSFAALKNILKGTVKAPMLMVSMLPTFARAAIGKRIAQQLGRIRELQQ